MWKQIAAQAPFKVMAPGYLPADYVYHDRNPESGGAYDIDTGGGTEKGLKMVYQLNRKERPATSTWASWRPTGWTRRRRARAGRWRTTASPTRSWAPTTSTERVWWKKDGVLYWVSNTLIALPQAQMS